MLQRSIVYTVTEYTINNSRHEKKIVPQVVGDHQGRPHVHPVHQQEQGDQHGEDLQHQVVDLEPGKKYDPSIFTKELAHNHF